MKKLFFKIISYIGYIGAFICALISLNMFFQLIRGTYVDSAIGSVVLLIYILFTYGLVKGSNSLRNIKKIERKHYTTSILISIPVILISVSFIIGVYEGFTSEDLSEFQKLELENNCDSYCSSLDNAFSYTFDFENYGCSCYNIYENLIDTKNLGSTNQS